MRRIPFFRHDLGQPEIDAVARVLAGPVLTTGETVSELEGRLSATLGRKHAVALTSCTGALHLSLVALGIGPGDEVITTPMTFVATSTAILCAGARPVFVDVEPETGNIDASRIEAAITPRTKAIVPVHLYGQMCDMQTIAQIAGRHGLRVIEDAAHCLEGSRQGARPGALADTACFSFYATKSITSGEGGALVTDDSALAAKLRLLRLHGMTRTAADRERTGYEHWDVTVLGWKYNLDNIHAALLLPQLDRLEANWRRRQALAFRYEEALRGAPGLRLPRTAAGVEHANHLFVTWIGGGRRDEVIRQLRARGIDVMVNYRAIHLLSHLRDALGHRPGDFPVAERLGDEAISLPLYPRMEVADVDAVAAALHEITAGRAR